MASNVVFLRLAFSCFPGGQVAKLFQDSSLGNAVNIVVTRLILLMEDQVKKKKKKAQNSHYCFSRVPSQKLQELPDCVRFVAPSLSYSKNPLRLHLRNQALAVERSMNTCKNREESDGQGKER